MHVCSACVAAFNVFRAFEQKITMRRNMNIDILSKLTFLSFLKYNYHRKIKKIENARQAP